MEDLLLEEMATAAATPTADTAGTLGGMNQFMSGFTIIVGLIALYAAFTGKGFVFKNDYPKAMQAEANKMMRTFCWIIGPVVTALGVFDYLGYSWAFIANISFTIPAIVIYFILFRRKFKVYLKK